MTETREMRMKKLSLEETFDLAEAGKPVYVLNMSKPKGDVSVTVFRPDGSPMLVIVPKTWIPVCVSDQVQPKFLRDSSDFRKSIMSGMLFPIHPDQAEEFMQDPDAQEERKRLHASKYAELSTTTKGEFALRKEDEVGTFVDQLEKVDNIKIVVRDIVGRSDISDQEKYSMLRADEDTLTKDDLEFIVANGLGRMKEWAASKLDKM